MTISDSEQATQVRTLLGGILRRLREAGDRSLHEMATRTGMSAGFLSEIERGLKEISTEKLLVLCKALEVPVGEVYLQLAQELGAGEPVWAVAWDADPRTQLRRLSQTLDNETVRTLARFSAFLATEGTPPKARIGFGR